MSGSNTILLLTQFVRLHWFKISLVAFLLFLIFKKDFSFTINLNAPAPTEPANQPMPQEAPVKQEIYTDQVQPQSVTPAPEKGVLDRFDFSSIISSSNNRLQDFLSSLDPGLVEKYIKRFKRVARNEQQKFGIPASITLANALLHSQAGKITAATQANNHFGLPCSSDWMGEKWEAEKHCYRAYENAWTSFRDHSFYITTGSYADLPQLGNSDYKAWAKAMEKKGFSKTDDLAEQLVQVVEQWKLYEYD